MRGSATGGVWASEPCAQTARAPPGGPGCLCEGRRDETVVDATGPMVGCVRLDGGVPARLDGGDHRQGLATVTPGSLPPVPATGGKGHQGGDQGPQLTGGGICYLAACLSSAQLHSQ